MLESNNAWPLVISCQSPGFLTTIYLGDTIIPIYQVEKSKLSKYPQITHLVIGKAKMYARSF